MNEIGGDRLVVQCQRPVLHKPWPAVQCLLDGAVFGLVAAALDGDADNAAGGVLRAVGQAKARATKTPGAIEPLLSLCVGDARLCDVNISGVFAVAG